MWQKTARCKQGGKVYAEYPRGEGEKARDFTLKKTKFKDEERQVIKKKTFRSHLAAGVGRLALLGAVGARLPAGLGRWRGRRRPAPVARHGRRRGGGGKPVRVARPQHCAACWSSRLVAHVMGELRRRSCSGRCHADRRVLEARQRGPHYDAVLRGQARPRRQRSDGSRSRGRGRGGGRRGRSRCGESGTGCRSGGGLGRRGGYRRRKRTSWRRGGRGRRHWHRGSGLGHPRSRRWYVPLSSLALACADSRSGPTLFVCAERASWATREKKECADPGETRLRFLHAPSSGSHSLLSGLGHRHGSHSLLSSAAEWRCGVSSGVVS